MIEFHSLYWNNIAPEMIEAQSSVMKHFNIPIKYDSGIMQHGAWLNKIMLTTNEDIVGFFDIDCVPLSREKIEQCIQYVVDTDSFIGCAQASNHIPPFSHIFAAPSFFIISKKCWERIGQPSFLENSRCDVAENVCYIAEQNGQPYRALYPDCFELEPVEGVWHLSNYGFFGVGCVFDNAVYHLFQGRYPYNRARFVKRCGEIINGTFSTEGFINSKDLSYRGRTSR